MDDHSIVNGADIVFTLSTMVKRHLGSSRLFAFSSSNSSVDFMVLSAIQLPNSFLLSTNLKIDFVLKSICDIIIAENNGA